jgi:hypothetical protein
MLKSDLQGISALKPFPSPGASVSNLSGLLAQGFGGSAIEQLLAVIPEEVRPFAGDLIPATGRPATDSEAIEALRDSVERSSMLTAVLRYLVGVTQELNQAEVVELRHLVTEMSVGDISIDEAIETWCTIVPPRTQMTPEQVISHACPLLWFGPLNDHFLAGVACPAGGGADGSRPIIRWTWNLHTADKSVAAKPVPRVNVSTMDDASEANTTRKTKPPFGSFVDDFKPRADESFQDRARKAEDIGTILDSFGAIEP